MFFFHSILLVCLSKKMQVQTLNSLIVEDFELLSSLNADFPLLKQWEILDILGVKEVHC